MRSPPGTTSFTLDPRRIHMCIVIHIWKHIDPQRLLLTVFTFHIIYIMSALLWNLSTHLDLFSFNFLFSFYRQNNLFSRCIIVFLQYFSSFVVQWMMIRRLLYSTLFYVWVYAWEAALKLQILANKIKIKRHWVIICSSSSGCCRT